MDDTYGNMGQFIRTCTAWNDAGGAPRCERDMAAAGRVSLAAAQALAGHLRLLSPFPPLAPQLHTASDVSRHARPAAAPAGGRPRSTGCGSTAATGAAAETATAGRRTAAGVGAPAGQADPRGGGGGGGGAAAANQGGPAAFGRAHGACLPASAVQHASCRAPTACRGPQGTGQWCPLSARPHTGLPVLPWVPYYPCRAGSCTSTTLSCLTDIEHSMAQRSMT